MGGRRHRKPAHLQRRGLPDRDGHQRIAPAAHAARHQRTSLLNLEGRHWPGQGAPAVEGILGPLPEEFEAKDFQATAQEVGLSIPTAERYIRQWVDTRIDKVSRGRYRKRKLLHSPGQKPGLNFVSESRSYILLLVNSAKIAIFVRYKHTHI